MATLGKIIDQIQSRCAQDSDKVSTRIQPVVLGVVAGAWALLTANAAASQPSVIDKTLVTSALALALISGLLDFLQFVLRYYYLKWIALSKYMDELEVEIDANKQAIPRAAKRKLARNKPKDKAVFGFLGLFEAIFFFKILSLVISLGLLIFVCFKSY